MTITSQPRPYGAPLSQALIDQDRLRAQVIWLSKQRSRREADVLGSTGDVLELADHSKILTASRESR